MTARNPHGTLNYTTPSEPTALEACAALVKHWDRWTDKTLETAALFGAAEHSEHSERAQLIIAARRALEQEGYR